MLEFSLALTFVSLLVLLVALIGRHQEMRREARDAENDRG